MTVQIGIDGKRYLVCEDEDQATRMYKQFVRRGMYKRIACFSGYCNALEL